MVASDMTEPILTIINGSFRNQRVTGQQRYATEIADRLRNRSGFQEFTPPGGWAGSAVREWTWALTRLPSAARKRDSTLLSLTSRAPLWTRQVLVVHDLFVLNHPEWFSRRYVLTHGFALRAQLRAAAAVVAVSETTAAEVREIYSGKVVIAPNAPSKVFLRSSPADEGDVEAALPCGLVRDRYLLAVGSLEPRKNLRTLAAAYARIPSATRRSFPLVIVGSGAEIYRDQGISWPAEALLTGYVTDDELRRLYGSARAVVFPSLAEGFGLPIVEAAAAGTPRLVVSDLAVFRWICGDGATYVDPLSTESVLEGLQTAINDRVPPVAITQERFDWDRSAAIVGDLCEHVTGS